MNRKNLIILLCLCLTLGACHKNHSIHLYDLRCENLHNPAAIDKDTPRFSWKIESNKNVTEQKAFQLLVASDASLLHEGKADLWDSGEHESSSSVLVAYQGKKLNPGSSAVWKVRVWDNHGNVSEWSKPASFGIGLLSPKDWQASYIAFNTDAGYRECPQLYKSFHIDETGSKYLLHVNSLGYHEVYLNGEKVEEGVLSPAVSQFNKRSLINTYDVSDLVKKGANDLLLWLGSGWYTTGLPGVVNDGPVVRAQLEKTAGNQSQLVLATDTTWLGRKSSYTRHGNWMPHQFGGEIVDGNLAKSDLLLNHPEREWKAVSLVEVPAHSVSPQTVEFNTIQNTIKPAAILQISKDTFLVDMGTNLTGWLELHFSELKPGQEITMGYCDHLTKEGKFNDRNQYDRYIASGTAPEVFINKFDYHGFRYVRVTGLEEMPSADSICAYPVRTDFEEASGFECSDPDLNSIHNMQHYTLQCLSIGGDLVDCPQLERLGYGGDGNASTVTAQTMYNLAPLYNNWLQAWADVIREDGGMPHTAPNPYRAGGGPYWCGFIITASWNTYLNYGDTLVLEKYYPVMQKWLEYVNKYSVDGLLKPWPNNDYRNWYLGDWATPAGIDQTAEASVDVINNSFIAVCFDNMEKIARVLGEPEDEQQYAAQKEQLQKRIHEVYFHETDNTYGTGTQIDIAYPMLAGAVPADKKKDVTQALYHETNVVRQGHFACGLVGLPVLTEWAVKYQAPDLMYSMMKQRGYPSYLYMLDNGATTTWEHWDGARSHIHNCYNGTGSWFYQAIGGIHPVDDAPAWQKVRIQPQVPDGVNWAKTFRETPYGKLAVNWELKDETMEMTIEIPVGVEAEVAFPTCTQEYRFNGLTKELLSNKSIALKSGKYTIEYER
ncbi:family 78 glycoside hydrolase catalytic domain [Maribellus sp. CM-23]|uniref:alpha-L-rhamnosidase n=1 Tax=Maribellus sp. CM-23 TaxID=2781026 RepID=UPI001F2D1A6C|nr:alpha-L-rhamnosidase [Maribellus sp. CM-23]MCE4564528.1 family 78 glycoside hydrolase catalytic domain [Maribellus sp. CM-23]